MTHGDRRPLPSDGKMNSGQKPVYIVSYPRSGNTWVRLLLEHALGIESHSAHSVDRKAQGIGALGDEHLTTHEKLQLVKSHYTSLPGSDDLIYVLRDGRDATASYWHYLRDHQRPSIGGFTEFLQWSFSSGDWWAFHVYSWLKIQHSHRVLLVRYEDLWKDQEHELGRMLGFLKLEPIRSIRDYATRISFENLHALRPTFFRSGRIGAWREAFSSEDAAFFFEHDLGLLTELGYAQQEGGVPVPPAGSDRRREAFLNCAIRRTHQLERELDEKERVIRELHTEAELRRVKLEELDKAFRGAIAEWARKHDALSQALRVLQAKHDEMLKSPVRFFRRAWQHLTGRRQGENG